LLSGDAKMPEVIYLTVAFFGVNNPREGGTLEMWSTVRAMATTQP